MFRPEVLHKKSYKHLTNLSIMSFLEAFIHVFSELHVTPVLFCIDGATACSPHLLALLSSPAFQLIMKKELTAEKGISPSQN